MNTADQIEMTALLSNINSDDVARMRSRILVRLTYDVGARPERASSRDWFVAAALAVRDGIMDRWRESNDRAVRSDSKQVCYMSMEFLIGRLLSDVLGNLGLTETVSAALASCGTHLSALIAEEPDAALGNGGLGRLAACFMESMATVGIPAYGYGIRYEYGLFRQIIRDGCQTEAPEPWLNFINPWEVERPNVVHGVGFGGSVHKERGRSGNEITVWRPQELVRALAYDTPIVGWQGRQINTLRLWSARSSDPLRLTEFNRGDHVGAVSSRGRAEAISRVLYPGDETVEGQELRLRQEYFFASASLQDILRRQFRVHGDLLSMPRHTAIQLNDTHPAIGIPELMRLLVDVHGFSWDEAWEISQGTFSYTNHTLLSEALERWPVDLMERVLPRHMQIIYEINARHMEFVRQQDVSNPNLLSSVSLIEETSGRRVRMGHLAFVGSHKINGVSGLHTDLLRQTLFADLNSIYPGRIVNETNGITFRRWLHRANPPLTALLTEVLGARVLSEPACLSELAAHADDRMLQSRLKHSRQKAKEGLAAKVLLLTGIEINPDAMFDVHIKRLHEYKRQLLNILQTISLYQAIRADPDRPWAPRVKIFAGKAAASYNTAKLIIQLIHNVANVVNHDPLIRNLLKVVFLPDYNVTLAESIIPAADLSEQISTAGMEASGTGNMKLMLNGALTIGTLDGANVEMRDHVGADNIFIFGLTVDEVHRYWSNGARSHDLISHSTALSATLDAIASGLFSPDDPGRYRGIVDGLRYSDTFMVVADFDTYNTAQANVESVWSDSAQWWRRSILNIAGAPWFSADRSVRGYAKDIWGITPSLNV
jgi:starch phosphorylase